MILPFPTKSRVWSLSTSANGTYFNTEFDQVYADLIALRDQFNSVDTLRRSDGSAAGITFPNVVIFNNDEGDESQSITYDSDSNLGDAFIADEDGVYCVSVTAYINTGAGQVAINVGTRQNAFNTSDQRVAQYGSTGFIINASWTGKVNVGEEIYILLSAGTGGSGVQNQVTVTRVR